MRRLRKHPRKNAAQVIQIRGAGEGPAHDHVPRNGRIERGSGGELKQPAGHRGKRLGDSGGIEIGAADDVAIPVEGEEELAATAVNLEDARARAYVERRREVFCLLKVIQLTSRATRG